MTKILVSSARAALWIFLSVLLGFWAPVDARAWTEMAPLQTAREQAAGAVINGKIYVYGGRNGTPGNFQILNSLEIYDPATNTWSYGASPLIAGARGVAAAVYNGKMYVFGGYMGDEGNVSNFAQVYDPATNTWSALTPRQTPTALATALVYNNKIYLFGGDKQGDLGPETTTLVQVFDPALNSWSTLSPMPFRVGSPVVAVVGDKAYALGGDTAETASGSTNKVGVYSFVADNWTNSDDNNVAPLNVASSFSVGSPGPVVGVDTGAAIENQRIFCLGGLDSFYRNPTDYAVVYDPAMNLSWQQEPLPFKASDHIALTATGGPDSYTVYVIGGRVTATAITDKVWAGALGNGQGILPSQEVPADTDLNLDGIPDRNQPGVIKDVKAVAGNAMFGVELPAGSGLTIASVESIPAATTNWVLPRYLPGGALTFTLTNVPVGAEVTVRIRTDYDIPVGATLWYMWDPVNGWYDYSDHATVNARVVELKLKDGDYGDADRVANGIIVDPCGPSQVIPVEEEQDLIVVPGGNGCFLKSVLR